MLRYKFIFNIQQWNLPKLDEFYGKLSKYLYYEFHFSGEDLISWLLTWAFVQTRDEGRVVAGELLEKAYLHPIGPSSKSTLEGNAARKAFADNQYNLYRFVSEMIHYWPWRFHDLTK